MSASPIDDLFDAAAIARGRAHAPYSKFAVGCALRDERGQVHAGANVENAAYPQSQCAEASAIGVMIAAGGKRISSVLIIASGGALIAPCGGCRQRLAEFADAATPVHLADEGGVRDMTTLGELLPRGFGAGHLKARG